MNRCICDSSTSNGRYLRPLAIGLCGYLILGCDDGSASNNELDRKDRALRKLKSSQAPTQQLRQWLSSPTFNHWKQHWSNLIRTATTVQVVATSTQTTQMEAADLPTLEKVYDFMVIGNGNAGRTAVEYLQKMCPGASIGVIDPIALFPSAKGSRHVHYRQALAMSFDPRHRTVQIQDSSTMGTVENKLLQYRCAVLIATGSRGAPPPGYLIDPQAWPQVLELRPPLHPQRLGWNTPSYTAGADTAATRGTRIGDSTTNADQSGPETETQQSSENESSTPPPSLPQSPFLSPTEVREQVIAQARQGHDMAILGCGWDALDMAAAIATTSDVTSRRRKTPRNTILLYGGSGPVNDILPPYLSSAVAKRLRVKKIRTMDRTLIRFVNYDAGRLQLYTAKSYDLLDTERVRVDDVVVAPAIHGSRGSAMVPTDRIPPHLQESHDGRAWYESWSQVSTATAISRTTVLESDDEFESTAGLPPLLVCYNDDGRIAVNVELLACRDVYAAGSVAKCAHSGSGYAHVTGMGVMDAAAAGRTAALNMAQHWNSFGGRGGGINPIAAVKDPTEMIWRSDRVSYDMSQPSSLPSLGVTALCVGMCDSERFATHGVWWTNQAAQQRSWMRSRMADEQDEESDTSNEGKNTKGRDKKRKKLRKGAIYGRGVVYYLDRRGRVQGIMTWGLPFTTNDDKDDSLNWSLVKKMRRLVATNCDHQSRFEFESLETSKVLEAQSRQLMAIAYEQEEASLEDGLAVADLPRPLHRFSEFRSVDVRGGSGIFRRGFGRDGVVAKVGEEPLFSVYPPEPVVERSVPRPIAGVGFAGASSEQFLAKQTMANYMQYEERERQWEENQVLAQPPREDRIWIRKGDETRGMSASDLRTAAMNAILGR